MRVRKLWQRIFGEDFYLELQDHGIAEETIVNSSLIRLSGETGIPMVATNDVHYMDKADAQSQAVLMCIQTATTVDNGRLEGFSTDEFYLKSSEEMLSLFSSHPEAVENTVRIAEKCNFDFDFGSYFLPSFVNGEGIPNEEYLKKSVYRGLGHILDAQGITEERAEEYRSRVEYELSVIIQMGFCEYFLIVSDFVNYAKSHGIPVGPAVSVPIA